MKTDFIVKQVTQYNDHSRYYPFKVNTSLYLFKTEIPIIPVGHPYNIDGKWYYMNFASDDEAIKVQLKQLNGYDSIEDAQMLIDQYKKAIEIKHSQEIKTINNIKV